MNKDSFLKALKVSLSGKIQDKEIDDIISDYEGFFATGLEEGKTEEEVSAELGNPADIAKSLTEGEDGCLSMCYAPIYKRIPALIIDIIIAGFPFVWFAPRAAIGMYFMPQVLFNMISSLLSTVSVSSHQWISRFQPFWSIAIIASALWFFLINPLCMLIFKGYTLGKKIMNIKVVSADGSDASFIQIIEREWIGKYLMNMLGSLLPSILALLPSIASLIWASVSEKHNTIHDIIAHTCVIDCQRKKVKR